jgi:hypothetical protein
MECIGQILNNSLSNTLAIYYDDVSLTSPITAELKLQSLKNDGCDPFSVIKIVKIMQVIFRLRNSNLSPPNA